eukprot:489734-Amphidinium_carterae.1
MLWRRAVATAARSRPTFCSSCDWHCLRCMLSLAKLESLAARLILSSSFGPDGPVMGQAYEQQTVRRTHNLQNKAKLGNESMK